MPGAAVFAVRAVVLVVAGGALLSCGRPPGNPAAAGGQLAGAIAEIEAGRRTTPLIVQPAEGGDARVTFLAKSSDGRPPRIVSDVTGWGERTADDTFDMGIGTMTRVGSTDWYRLDAHVAPGARVEYLVVLGDTDYRLDPNNPRTAAFREGDTVSEFVTPGFVPPEEFAGPPAEPAGTTTEAIIESRALGGQRRVIVYAPPGYRDDGAYAVAVFHSGWSVARAGEAPRVLDWLIAHQAIEPVVGVFLESHRPGDTEDRQGEPMRTFLNEEVLAWTASRFGVTRNPEERALLAISYGAKDALDAALAPARAYGRLGLLIPGRRIRAADLETAAVRRDRVLRVAILAGRYDAANVATARGARQALSHAGHDVDYIEVPEGHNPTTWRNHLGDVLVSLFKPR